MLSHPRELDRFIPNYNNSSYQLFSGQKTQSNYENYIKKNLCPSTKLLNYANKENQGNNACLTRTFSNKSLEFSYQKKFQSCQLSESKTYHQKLHNSTQPQKVLDVPGFRDDFYLNTLDWSPNGPICVALDNEAYLYTPSNIIQLHKSNFSYLSSIKFCDFTVSLGFSDGKICIYDIQTKRLVRQINSHEKRVSALEYSSKNILYSGSKDRNILVNDVRMRQATINRLNIHQAQICSLKCQPDSQTLLASGSNDNNVAIWDIRRHQLLKKYIQHKGAVKAIAWCPWKTGVIATAGGAGDKTIRLWNVNQNEDLSISKTQTQISSLIWNEDSGTLISAHGYPKNEINFWKPELIANRALTLEKVKTLNGHSGRILNMSASPSQTMICSLSSDQTLRLWKILQSKQDPWKLKQFPKDCRWSLKLK